MEVSSNARDDYEGLEDFKKRLVANGVDVGKFGCRCTAYGSTKTLEDLHTEVFALQESKVSTRGGKTTLHLEIVKVYLIAQVAGNSCCLIEHDQFDLHNGRQRSVMRALEKKMRPGESWRSAMHSSLESQVGLDRQSQDMYLCVDEDSYRCHEERSCSIEYPGLATDSKIHEIHVHCSPEGAAIPENQTGESSEGDDLLAALDKIGLPGGRDFVTRETVEGSFERLHVWCWKSREYERNSRLLEFSSFLQGYGVDVSKFGLGSSKTLFQFYVEVKEDKDCSLREAPGSPGRLQRVVDLLKIKVIAEVLKRKRVLSASEQVLDDGRTRKVNQLLVHKLRGDEEWHQAIIDIISFRLGLDPEVQEKCFKMDVDKEEYHEETAESKGYAGLESHYKIRTVTLNVIDPQHPALERIGLPRGNDFVTKEGEMGEKKGGKVNVWTWAPLSAEEKEQKAVMGTALEELNRALHDAEDMIMQTCSHPQAAELGIDRALTTALQKIRFCAERSANIDATLAEVDIQAMMSNNSEAGKKDDKEANEGIADFIAANFTRTRTIPDSSDVRDTVSRRQSMKTLSPAVGISVVDTPAMTYLREKEDDFDLDVFEVSNMANSKVIQIYGEVALVPVFKLCLSTSGDSARKFLEKVGSLYYRNSYHNAEHAVQVCHSAQWLLKSLGVHEQQTDIEQAAFLISCLCHDVKHFGRNNAFLVNSEHPLALVYNNAKVLENMHAATTFELLLGKDDGLNALAGVSREDRSDLRSQIIEYILATDMSEHFEVISKFRVKLESPDFSVETDADRRFAARMIIKSGDIGHSSLPWKLHVRWSGMVMQEFFEQGDQERELGLPISALCDRNAMADIGKSQKGFLEFVCMPLFEALTVFHETCIEKEEEEQEESRMKSIWTASLKQNVISWLEDKDTVEALRKTLTA